jgi:hypothetical protein
VTQIILQPTEALLDELVRIKVASAEPHLLVRVRVRCDAFKAEASCEFLAVHTGSVRRREASDRQHKW